MDEAQEALYMGFDGKLTLHPDQVCLCVNAPHRRISIDTRYNERVRAPCQLIWDF